MPGAHTQCQIFMQVFAKWGKQIVRITTTNKSLHIYNEESLPFILFFLVDGQTNGCMVRDFHNANQSKCAKEQIRNSHDDKKKKKK